MARGGDRIASLGRQAGYPRIAMPKVLLFIALVIAAVSGLPVVATPIVSQQQQANALSPFDAAMTRAFAALAARKADEARARFEEAARLDPKSMSPWLGLADVASLKEDVPGIEAALKKAAEVAPDAAEPVIARARLQYSRKAYDDAELLLRKAASFNPKTPVPWVDLGDMYATVKNDPAKALEFFRLATQASPDHAGAHYALGVMQAKLRDPLGATISLERAKELGGSKNPLPALALGQVYAQVKKWKEARAAFSQAIDIQPSLVVAYVGRAGTFVASGNAKSAIADLKKAEELAPNNPEPAFRIGMLHQEARAFKEAYEAYGRAIRIEPKLVLAYNNLAWMAATRRERLDEALAWIQKARSLAPKESTLFDTHGWVLRARGDLTGAAAVLSEGISENPSADLHHHLGVVRMEMGQLDDARANLRKALQIQPDFSDALDAKTRLKQLDAPPPAAK
jgi:tetratricopeptide (TPR) repeat protein